jgi:hypothetical protein
MLTIDFELNVYLSKNIYLQAAESHICKPHEHRSYIACNRKLQTDNRDKRKVNHILLFLRKTQI